MEQNYQIEINTIFFPLHPETPAEGQRLDDLFGPQADIEGMMHHLKMLMDAEGLPFGQDRYMTFNSRLAQELAKWAEGKPQSQSLHTALYQAYFVEGRNIGDMALLLGLAEQVGLPAEEAQEILEQRTMKSAVDDDWRYAISLGVSAVPTFAVGLKGVVGAQPYEQLTQFLEHVGVSKR